MAFRRGPDGEPVEVPSVSGVRRSGTGADGPTKRAGTSQGDEDTTKPRGGMFPWEAPARRSMNDGSVAGAQATARPGNRESPTTARPARGMFPQEPTTKPLKGRAAVSEQAKTRLWGGRRPMSRSPKDARSPSQQQLPDDYMADPVVGWLVVVEGPGKGAALRLGRGNNLVGRGTDADVRLDFGDDSISRHRHAVVTYEERSNQFFIAEGSSRNLIYLDGDYLDQKKRLAHGTRISMGDTILRFVALCDSSFSW